ncbi:MAG: peptidoglycan-binding protein [Propionibacteriaceae bacterium]|nr:peptidoglycan-binding protein [Propionibacteriaceae bacterium]
MVRYMVVGALALLTVAGCAQQPSSLTVNAEPEPSPSAIPSVPSSSPTAPETPVESATSEATPALPDAMLSPGEQSEKVRELQHRLLQLGWYEGKITGEFDTATTQAVEGFQAKRELPELGFVDQATWDALVDMTRQPTHDEMHNILVPGPALLKQGNTGDNVKDLQARLKQIGWFDALIDGSYGETTVNGVKGFQKKREIPVTGEVDQRTLDRLNAMTRKPTENELNNVVPTKSPTDEMGLDDRCLTGRVLCISKAQRKLAWVIDGQIQMTMSVRFGSELTPTRNGVFSVGWKSKDHVSTLYDTPMPYAMFFSGGQAIHYSADFAANGYNGASHGCVNVRDKAAIASLFDQVAVGDKVVVYTE